jgi:hypothetical protein
MTVEELIDELYGLALEEFTQARNDAARELRRAGRRDEADRVKALRKPTAAAAAVNRLVREHRGKVEAFLAAAASLRDAQLTGKGDLADATRREREALDQLTEAGGASVRQSLLAAAVDEQAAHAILAARLEHELEPRGFGTLLAQPLPAGAKRRPAPQAPAEPPPPAKKKPDDRAAREKVREAKAALADAAAAERQARRSWDAARRELEQAQAALEKAQRQLDEIRAR